MLIIGKCNFNFISSTGKADLLKLLEHHTLTKVFPPNVLSYRLYSYHNGTFEGAFLEVLNKNALLKKGFVRATHDLCITKP